MSGDSFVEIFIEEATQSLESWEQACLKLERVPSIETIQLLFRLAHNMKGSSLSVGLNQFGKFVHQVEELLTKLKNNALPVNTDVVACLLDVQAVLNSWLVLMKSDTAAVVETSELEARISQLSTGNTSGEIQRDTTAQAPLENQLVNAQAGDIVFDDAAFAATKSVSQSTEPKQVLRATASAPVVAPKQATSAPQGDDFIRVKLNKLDELVQLMGELVVAQNILQRHEALGTIATVEAANVVSRLSKMIKEAQEAAFSLRMMPLEQTFQKMQRIVRDLGAKQSKEIHFEVYGSETELDKTVIERLGDPLTHLIRNAVDHGLETPDEREASGKRRVATVKLGATMKEDSVEIVISDDGRGMDAKKLFAKAVEKGLIPASAQLSPSECYELIFLPGFSTKEQVSDVSGRGVGMDVVRTALNETKGSIGIKTELGKGTEFHISLPLSLSIIRAFICKIQSDRYAIPISQVVEIVNSRTHVSTNAFGKNKVVELRGEAMPVHSLRELLRYKKPSDLQGDVKQGFVVQQNGNKVLLEVDEIEDEQSVVLKKLSRELQGLPGIIASAVLSTGEPALVVNPAELVDGGKRNVA